MRVGLTHSAVLDLYPWVGEFEGVQPDGGFVNALCPLRCHRHARLRFWVSNGDLPGKLCLKCWAGCDALEVLRAVGRGWRDCYPDATDWKAVRRVATAVYPYHDEAGGLLYQTVRLEPGYGGKDKTFFQRRPDPANPGRWVNNLGDVRRVLYRLFDVLAAPASGPVLVVAGEKDVESCRRVGVVATTNVCGERAEWLDSYSGVLAGRAVVVVEDRDSAGRRHANEVVGSLLAHGVGSLRRVVLPAKDATAFLNGLRTTGMTGRDELRDRLLSAVAAAGRAWAEV